MKKEVQVATGIETLFGTRDENLRLLESTLQLKIHLRKNSLEIEGRTGSVDCMERIVEQYGELLGEGLSFLYFSDRNVVRHHLVQQIVLAYEQHGRAGAVPSGKKTEAAAEVEK
jgi:phosphate starvation-inducible protein PhoH